MDNSGMSVADVAALSGGMGGFGGFEGLIYLAVIASMFGGWGGFGFGGNGAALAGNLATQNDMQQMFNYSNLLDGNRDLSNLVTSGTAQAVAATNQTFHDTLAALNDKYSEISRDIYGVQTALAELSGKQSECCCSTLRAIDGVNYNNAINTAAINANTTAAMQKVLDAISQNKIDSLEAQVSQLQLQNQLNGVVRYPTNTFYAVPSPCFGGCAGNGNF